MNKPLELLSPAGSFDALKAAVINGADAVYLGGGKFNARVNAGNFTGEELSKALDYAHERGVRVYITLNTLLKNEELEEALKFAAFSYQEGADAFIVQDLGMLSILKKTFPELPVHASTQMTAANSSSVRMLENLGVKRVVLSRELSLKEIGKIADECKAELEVFVHGALCVSYSGQCLMSSFIGARSGNRGLCAQPCRLPWSFSREGKSFGKEAYLISPRDLMAIGHLPDLKKSKVTALKLEGRMKSPEYVGIVTSVYRKYLNLLESGNEDSFRVDQKDIEKLMQAFNRGGFTQSYLEADRNFSRLVYTKHPKNQGIYIGAVLESKPLYAKISLEKPLNMGDGIEIIDPEEGPQSLIVTAIKQDNEHTRFADMGSSPWVGDIKTVVSKGSPVYKTLSKPLFEEARKAFEQGEAPLVPLNMHFFMKTGERAVLKAYDNEGNIAITESDVIAQKAINKPLSAERIEEQLKKTGDTPYWLNDLVTDTDGMSVIPVSALNLLRRSVLEEIRSLRTKKRTQSYAEIALKREKTYSQHSVSLSAYFYEVPETINEMDGLIKRVYLPVIERDTLVLYKKGFRGGIFLRTPAILKDAELTRVINEINGVSDLIDGLTYGNIGACEAFRRAFPDKALCADYTMNLFNDEALLVQKDLGAETAVLSPELRLQEVQSFSPTELLLEAFVYGRIPLMTMEHCPSASETACSGVCRSCPKSRGYLKDRKGEVFPFVRDPLLGRTQIFNSQPLLMDDISVLSDTQLDFLRLCFTDEDAGTRLAIVSHYSDKLAGRIKPDEENMKIIKSIKDRGFTKGHWFRGV